jgi:hypothetical protein
LVHLFADDAVFAVLIDRPGWHNGFEHDPKKQPRPGRALRELAETVPQLAAPAVPVHRPDGSGQRRFSLPAGLLGLLTALA